MKTEKLSGSIWVSKEMWNDVKNRKDINIRIVIKDYRTNRNEHYPIELTITAKIPERKREFTEGELLKMLQDNRGTSLVIDDAFKENRG